MNKLTLPTFSTLLLTLVCTNVFAVDGRITVNGVVTDQTCTLQGESRFATGLKDITVNLPTLSKSWFTPTLLRSMLYPMLIYLTNADGTANCDVATTQAFKGIHLSVTSPTDLDTTDKTLLINKVTGAGGASIINPIFIQFHTMAGVPVDFSAPRGVQAESPINIFNGNAYLQYDVAYVSKTGIVDAQNVQATVNYTLHYN